MAAPKKPEGEKIEQIKVHVRKSEKEIYTRKLFESWMEQHRMKKHPEFLSKQNKSEADRNKRMENHKPVLSSYSANEQALIDIMITAFRKTSNQIQFINRVKTLK